MLIGFGESSVLSLTLDSHSPANHARKRRTSRGKRGSPPISNRDAASSVIHAGRQAKVSSSWCTTRNAAPPCKPSPDTYRLAKAGMKSIGDACFSLLFAAVCRRSEQHLDHSDIDVLFHRWVAKLCRKVWSDTRLSISALWAAVWQARLSWRVVIGCTRSRPGNNQPCGHAARHQARSSSSRCGDSIT